jgi:hypothetical protein
VIAGDITPDTCQFIDFQQKTLQKQSGFLINPDRVKESYEVLKTRIVPN